MSMYQTEETNWIRIEAGQKGWLLVKAVADLLEVVQRIEASADLPWDEYALAKAALVEALAAFERWHGR